MKESQWFKPSTVEIGRHLKDSYTKYKQYVLGGKQQKQYSKSNFSFEKMQELISNLLGIKTMTFLGLYLIFIGVSGLFRDLQRYREQTDDR